MTREELFSAIGEAEEAWVEAAGAPMRAAKKRRWPLAAAAALLALLVACGVQQGWFQFLTPDQWREEADLEQRYRVTGTWALTDEKVDNEMWLGNTKIVFQSQLLRRESFGEQAKANGWDLDWAAADELGAFSATQMPCWDAAQLNRETLQGGQLALSGTALEVPYSLVGTWSRTSRTALSVSFNLADGVEEKKVPISESAELTPLEGTGWNDAVFLDDALTFGKETYFVLAWKPLAKPVENALGPQDALEDPPAPHTFDRCLLTVYFDGMDKEEALALAQALLQNA